MCELNSENVRYFGIDYANENKWGIYTQLRLRNSNKGTNKGGESIKSESRAIPEISKK